MKYEIINPSDACTIEGEREVVFAAVVLLSGGQYGARSDVLSDAMPPLAFMGSALEWWQGQFGRSLDDSLTALSKEMATALASVRLGSLDDPPDAERERTSLNDIVGRAHRLAAQLRSAQEVSGG